MSESNGPPLTYADLERIERTTPRPSEPWPSSVSLDEIEVAPAVFQHRLPSTDDREADPDAEGLLMRDLARALRDEHKPLDAIVLTYVGRRLFLVDGHHRLTAYREFGWQAPVPVRWVGGNLFEARNAAMSLNRKNKLRMTDASRLQAAWTLMKERRSNPARKLTWERIRSVTGVAKGTLSNMHGVLGRHGDAAINTVRWSEARRLDWPNFVTNPEAVDAWLEGEVGQKLSYLKEGKPDLRVRVETTARALEQLGIHKALMSNWLYDAAEELIDRVREAKGDKAARQVEEALGGLREEELVPFDL